MQVMFGCVNGKSTTPSFKIIFNEDIFLQILKAGDIQFKTFEFTCCSNAIPTIFFVNKTLSCSLYHGKKKTHKTSGYSDNSERNINFKFDRLRAVNCTI